MSLCQYGEQNGDLMRDCDLVFMITDLPIGAAAEPVSFRNDYLGIVQDVYRYDQAGKRSHVVLSLKQELKEFARAWLGTLRDQVRRARAMNQSSQDVGIASYCIEHPIRTVFEDQTSDGATCESRPRPTTFSRCGSGLRQ